MGDKILLKRIFIIIFGLVLILISINGYKRTHLRIEVLREGKLENATVSNVSYNKGGYSVKVKIKNEEFDAGDALKSYSIGDNVEVFRLKNIKYVVLRERKNTPNTYRGYFTIEIICFILGICLIILSTFIKSERKKYKLNDFKWINTKDKNVRNLDLYFEKLFKNSEFVENLEKNSSIQLNQKIQELNSEFSNEMNEFIEYLKLRKDYKLKYIQNALN